MKGAERLLLSYRQVQKNPKKTKSLEALRPHA